MTKSRPVNSLVKWAGFFVAATSFGEQYQRQIYGHPDYWEVENAVAVRNWLVQQQIAVANQRSLN